MYEIKAPGFGYFIISESKEQAMIGIFAYITKEQHYEYHHSVYQINEYDSNVVVFVDNY